ncbi:hypothetical protein SARC_10197 [Sphaeroforma arctica JP610]|uniref:Uncharacterized protein n=1 Tax=Sphaeroforma arctica JP610 TaxID=667725 RepID=A0A0L0FMS2_9EUKA|nr:hypothetical protein SARC_10197 [Sphaeroforma arctica JP610]KNC77338.1 hypothetical protein SARC_10197 [Sphaeroforma arctica JP610]|eukprot:XP_014151240.1 hypothetical protein SARC_10197 [Sphaeroforma arctica JP610]
MANIADKESVSNDEDATKEHSKSVPHRDTQQPQQPCSPGASKSDTRTHIDAYSDIYGGWKGGTDGGTDGGTSSPKSPQTHQKASPPMSPANPLSRPYTPPLPSSLSQKTTHRQLATTHIQSPLHTQASTNTQGNIGLQLGAEMGFGGVTDDSDDKVNMNRSESVGRFTVQSRSSSAKLKSPVQHEFYRTPSHLTKSADGMKNQELGVQWSFGEEDTRDMLLLPSGDVSSSNMSSSSTPQSPTEHYS